MTHALGISEFIPAGMLTIKIRVGLRFDCKARRNSVDAHENKTYSSRLLPRAQMAELVDALRSGRSVLMDVEVRVLFWAPSRSPGRFFIARNTLKNNQKIKKLAGSYVQWSTGMSVNIRVFCGYVWGYRVFPAR